MDCKPHYFDWLTDLVPYFIYPCVEPERMCDSIDKASVVIACVNQEYLESPQCRHGMLTLHVPLLLSKRIL